MTQATATPNGSNVSNYWRSLDQLQSTDAFKDFLAREFPQAASEFPEGVSRRRWMQLMSASFALAGAAGCRWETEQIAPFVSRPEGYVPGTQTYYATNISWAGAPRHLLVTKYDERPIKIEGNPDHPASRGAADAFTQAATLALYDPDRAKSVTLRDGSKTFTKTWKEFEDFLAERIEAAGDGASFAILTPSIDSHTFHAALDRVKDTLPEAKFYQHDALSRENELAGAELAFGERVRTQYRLAEAKVIAAFDADVLTQGPDSLRAARDYAEHRDPDGEMNRLWAVESFFSTTGATADHRLPMKSSAIGGYLAKLRDKVKELAADDSHDHADNIYGEDGTGEPTPDQFLGALADDLVHNQGKSVVAVGPGQPAESHAIAHEINSLLGNLGETVLFTEEPKPRVEVAGIEQLMADAEQITTLLILDGNPAYCVPGFAEAIEPIEHTVHLAGYEDETSRVCEWSLPQTHPLEEWGDVIAWDGTVGVSQPMIDPLLGGRSVIELLAVVAGDNAPNAQQMVLDALAEAADVPDEGVWNKMLHDGLLEGSAAEPVTVSLAKDGIEPPTEAGGEDTLELVFTPSSSTYDGRFANSGWLQETPDFLTKLTWDNAALVSPVTAEE
ncbi:MAG: TAT-variant-translocated molybdopterin oxidoreductase, partial [Planctomycetota bacterium]